MNENTRSPETLSTGWGYSSFTPAPSVYHEEDQEAIRLAADSYRKSMEDAQRPPVVAQSPVQPDVPASGARTASEEHQETPLTPHEKRIRELLGMKRIDALVRKGDIVLHDDGSFGFASEGLARNWGKALSMLEERDAKEAQQAATKDAASAAEQAEELRRLRSEVEAMKAGLNKENQQTQVQQTADTLSTHTMSGIDGFNAMAAQQAARNRNRHVSKEWHWFPKTLLALTTTALLGSGLSVGINTVQAHEEVTSWSSAVNLGLSSSLDQATLFFTRK